jgi:hypothetical protein
MSSDPSRTSAQACHFQELGVQNRNGPDLTPGKEQPSRLAAIREGPPINAVEHIRRNRGGSQSHLLKCSDGKYYVVKFPNNPQGKRTLVNEMLCGFLATKLALPVPSSVVVQVDQDLIQRSEQMFLDLPDGRARLQAGACFGSEHPGPDKDIYDSWPERRLDEISNLADFAGMLVFDIWTSNNDFRQVLFFRKDDKSQHRVAMVDNGFCFRATEWAFKDKPRLAMYPLTYVYKSISRIESFEPWLTKLESEMNRATIAEALARVPKEWYRRELTPLKKLLAQLEKRRAEVRHQILSLVATSWRLFPNWSEAHSTMHSSADRRAVAASTSG